MTQPIAAIGSPLTINIAGGGKVYAFNNLSTTPQQILKGNPSRQSITFHNPGGTDAFVAPTTVQNTGSDVTLTPTTSALGGCYRVFANGGTLTKTGEVQKAWQAFSAAGSGNPLTVDESNV